MSDNDIHLILWLDLETPGTNDGRPIEVAAAITDVHGELVGNTFRSLIALPLGFDPRWVPEAVRDMHSESGLWKDLSNAMSQYGYFQDDPENIDVRNVPIELDNVDDRLLNWILQTTEYYDFQTQSKVLDTLNVRLAGSGVSHFDSRLVKQWLPYTWGQIIGFDNETKPTADIGVLRRLLKYWNLPELVAPTEFDTMPDVTAHRALDDVILFIEQYKWYRRVFTELMMRSKYRGPVERTLPWDPPQYHTY